MSERDSRADERVPASIRIRLKYPDEATFVQRYAANISRGGIFIATKQPKPVGTSLRFEFQLADGQPVIRGDGAVVWIKTFDPARPEQPHGMGVRFVRLDGATRQVIERALAWKERARQQQALAEDKTPQPQPLPQGQGNAGDEESTRRVNIAAVLSRVQAEEPREPRTPEHAHRPSRPVPPPPPPQATRRVEAARPEPTHRPPPPPPPAKTEPASEATAAMAPSETARAVPATPSAAGADDFEESGEILILEAEPAPAEAQLEPAPGPIAPRGNAEPDTSPTLVAIDGGSSGPGAAAKMPTGHRLAGVDTALAYLSALPSPTEHPSADLDALLAECGLDEERVLALASRVRTQTTALVEKLSGGEGEFDWLREPPRPEPLPSPTQAHALLARLLASSETRES